MTRDKGRWARVLAVSAVALGASRAPEPRTVVFVGTSLTAGYGLDDPSDAYPALVQAKIDSAGLSYRTVNAGVSGETSAGTLRRVPWLLRGALDVLVLETGANDGLRGLDVAATRANIDSIVRRVRVARPGVRICLVQMEAPPNMGASYTAAFRAIYPGVAREEKVVLVPFLLAGVAGHADLNQADGIHPNLRGEQIVAANVWHSLEPVLRAAAE